MTNWKPTEVTIEAIKETIKVLACQPSYIDIHNAKLLQIWLDGQKARNNPGSDNPLEK